MKLGIKEIIILGAITVFSFPIMYAITLFATGNAHVVLTKPTASEQDQEKRVRMMHSNSHMDSLSLAHSNTFVALENERTDVNARKEELQQEEARLNILKQEVESKTEGLASERVKIEKLVGTSDSLDKKRIQQLAKVYGAMRATEAARILETLDDKLLVKILGAINDDRQKAKIMSALSQEKAAKISELIGKPVRGRS
jgi:flagellar motility protein MotE (MotC chaperone)